jgi:hypothetical protein
MQGLLLAKKGSEVGYWDTLLAQMRVSAISKGAFDHFHDSHDS